MVIQGEDVYQMNVFSVPSTCDLESFANLLSWDPWVAQRFSTGFHAQGLILETQDRVPRRAPCMEPASPLPVSASLSLSLSVCVCVYLE